MQSGTNLMVTHIGWWSVVGGLSVGTGSYIDTIIEYFPTGVLSVCREFRFRHTFFVPSYKYKLNLGGTLDDK